MWPAGSGQQRQPAGADAAGGEVFGGSKFQQSLSPYTSWLPGFVVVFQTLVACVMYSIIIGDLRHDPMRGLGVTGWFAMRENLLAAVSAGVQLPLCLLRDFAMLSYTSMLGVTGVLYTTCFMVSSGDRGGRGVVVWRRSARPTGSQ